MNPTVEGQAACLPHPTSHAPIMLARPCVRWASSRTWETWRSSQTCHGTPKSSSRRSHSPARTPGSRDWRDPCSTNSCMRSIASPRACCRNIRWCSWNGCASRSCSGDDLTQAFKIANGIDFHAVEALRIVHFKTGDRFWQYADAVAETLPQNASKLVMQTGVHQAMLIGQWFVRARGAVSEANLGLSAGGRELREFVLSRDAEVLVSKSAATLDGWTTQRALQVASPRVTGAVKGVKNAEFAAGGGEQMFIPRAWDTVKAVARPGK